LTPLTKSSRKSVRNGFSADKLNLLFPQFIRAKKTGTEKFSRSGILLHKKRLFLLVTQQFELLFALVLGDFFTPFFLQVTHFLTFKVVLNRSGGTAKTLQAFPDRQTFGSHAYSHNITPLFVNSQ
jgi:hypothetical protein